MSFQDNRANQVICTGISQIILGCCVFTLCFILSERKDDLEYIFQIGVAYWGASPVSNLQSPCLHHLFKKSLYTLKNSASSFLD